MTTRVDVELAEQSEAETLFEFETGASPDTAAALGMDAARLGGGVVLSMRHDPTGYWSKALGFGFREPVTAGLVEEVCEFYRSRRTPVAVLQFAPSVLPAGWAGIHARANIRPGSTWVKLARELDTAVDGTGSRLDPSLRVAPIEPGQAEAWAATTLRGFGMPEEHLLGMVTPVVGRPGWHPYGVWHGDTMVAAAAMRVDGEAAQLFGGATLPEWRGRGAQSALLAVRAREARAAGCRWLIAETGAEAPDEHNSSLHNMLRLGFTVQYERRNWVFRP